MQCSVLKMGYRMPNRCLEGTLLDKEALHLFRVPIVMVTHDIYKNGAGYDGGIYAKGYGPIAANNNC